MPHTTQSLRWLYTTGFAIILALPAILAFPWFSPTDFGKVALFRSITAIMLAVFAWQYFFKKQYQALPNPRNHILLAALTALAAAFTIATLFSVDIHFSLWGSPLRSGGLITFLCYGIFSLLAFLLFTPADWKKAWSFSIFIGNLIAIIGIIQFYGFMPSIVPVSGTRPPSTVGSPTFLALYLILLFFITLGFAVREPKKSLKAFYLASLPIMASGIAVAGTRAVFLGAILAGLYCIVFFSKKFFKTKVVASALLLLIVSSFIYLNSTHRLPPSLANNPIISRISLASLTADQRTDAWKIALQAFKARPLFGYGPENFHVAFDRFYNPETIPYDSSTMFNNWWDRAHNMVLDIAVQTGIVGLVAYLGLLVVAWRSLQQAKTRQPENAFLFHSLQAGLLGYVIANLLSFDSFTTYLTFFLLIGYILHVTKPEAETNTKKIVIIKPGILKTASVLAGCLLIFFVWHYNFRPFTANASITTAMTLADQQQCEQAIQLAEKSLTRAASIDSYVRLQYVELLKTCAAYHPENDLTYAQKGIEIMKVASESQPLYSRLWLFLGGFANVVASHQTDAALKTQWLKQAKEYLLKNNELAPRRQETFLEMTKVDATAGDYQAMKADATTCVNLNKEVKECWFRLAMSEIYLKDIDQAKKDLQTAAEKGHNLDDTAASIQLIDAYLAIGNYREIASIYERLLKISPNVSQYHSSLAFAYRELREYAKARYEAKQFLYLEPTKKADVDAFLRTLPY